MPRILPIAFFLTAAACFGQHHGSTAGAVSAVPYSPFFGSGRNAPFPVHTPGRRHYGNYPLVVGAYGYSFYGGDAGYNPSLAPPDAAPPAPPVIINQYFGTPAPATDEAEQPADQSIHIYSQPGPQSSVPETDPEPRTYLIAYRDHSVYTALAYWVEDHTLHYVTAANTHNQADLSLIDIDFTKKLNTDRNMLFNVDR